MSILIRECQECGQIFKGGPRSWYCPECREIRAKKSAKAYRERKANGKSRSIGSTDFCKNCGKTYTVNSGLQVYCEECGSRIAKENQAKHKLAEYHMNKDIINPIRNERRRVPPRRCAFCGNDFAAQGQKKYCSAECRKQAYVLINKVYEKRRIRKKSTES